MQEWLAYLGTDDQILDTFWTPRFNSAEYLVVILEIIVPGNEQLISSIMQQLHTPSGATVATADDLLQVTEQSWVTFFRAHVDLLPKKYLLGSLEDRVHSFIQDLSKILFVAAPADVSVSYPAADIPYLQGAFEKDVLVRFFASFSSFSFFGYIRFRQKASGLRCRLGSVWRKRQRGRIRGHCRGGALDAVQVDGFCW